MRLDELSRDLASANASMRRARKQEEAAMAEMHDIQGRMDALVQDLLDIKDEEPSHKIEAGLRR